MRHTATVSPRTPVVTVIIPTMYRRVLLARAIDSVRHQTFQDFEVIVVDDGPSAAAADVVSAAGDPRLRYLCHESGRGAGAARNTALHEARAEFVAFLDDDDTWFPTKLARQLERFAAGTPDLGLVYCSSLKYSDISQRVISESLARPLRRGHVDFLRSTMFGTSVPLIRRRCLEDVGGFDESLPGTQDRDLWIRLAKRFAFDYVDDVLVRHHIHGDQITSNLDRKIAARERLLAKYHGDLASHPDIMAQHLWRLGMLCSAGSRYAEGRRFIWQAIRWQPRLRGAYRDLAQSIMAPDAYRKRLLENVFQGADGVPFFY